MCLKPQHNVRGKNVHESKWDTKKISVHALGMKSVHNTDSSSTCYPSLMALFVLGGMWTLNMYDLGNSLLDGEIESFICHNFNVALSPIPRFFLFQFFVADFLFGNCPFFLWQKRSPKNKQVFYSNTNLLGFRPSQIAATDFFYLSVCQVDLDAIVIVEVVSGVRRLCRFALVFSFFSTFSYSSRVWFRSFKKTKKKSLVKIVFFCETYNAYKMSNTCSFYGQHPWRWIKHSGYRKYAFIALASTKMKTANYNCAICKRDNRNLYNFKKGMKGFDAHQNHQLNTSFACITAWLAHTAELEEKNRKNGLMQRRGKIRLLQ